MGEPEAIKAIEVGYVSINNKVYSIEPHSRGCTGCVFDDYKICPDIARHICCTGGNILKEITEL